MWFISRSVGVSLRDVNCGIASSVIGFHPLLVQKLHSRYALPALAPMRLRLRDGVATHEEFEDEK